MILHWRRNLRYEMQWEVHFDQNVSTIVCLSRICQGDASNHIKINDNFSHHTCHLVIDIFMRKILSPSENFDLLMVMLLFLSERDWLSLSTVKIVFTTCLVPVISFLIWSNTGNRIYCQSMCNISQTMVEITKMG